MSEQGFSGTKAATIVGITYRQLDYWARTDLIRPSLTDAAGSGSRRLRQRRQSALSIRSQSQSKQTLGAKSPRALGRNGRPALFAFVLRSHARQPLQPEIRENLTSLNSPSQNRYQVPDLFLDFRRRGDGLGHLIPE
jgi:DNA-binding transcriptional MerR regulator